MVGLQRRFYSHILQAKSIIDEHGDLFSLVVEAPERFTQIKEKNKFTEEVLRKWMFRNGIHMLDMFLFLGGKVNKVTSVNRTWKEELHPDSFHALVEFDGGTVGQYISNWSSPGGWSVKMYGNGVKIDISPVEEGIVTFSDGRVEELRIEDTDVDFKVNGDSVANAIKVDAGTDTLSSACVKVSLPNLPTSDPGVAGQLWNNSNVLNISAG